MKRTKIEPNYLVRENKTEHTKAGPLRAAFTFVKTPYLRHSLKGRYPARKIVITKGSNF